MGKVTGFIRLMRPINCAIMGFAVFVGAVLAHPEFSNFSWLDILYGFLTGFSLTAASMAINDYYDREIDAINEPDRPLPSGKVTSREALSLVFVLSVVGFFFAYLTSFLCLVVAVISWFVVVTYVTIGKRSGLPGNLLVSTCVAIPFVYGSLIILNQIPLSVLLFTLMAFLSNTGREITKGIVDVKGDKAEGIGTLAVRYGEKTAGIVAISFYISAVALTPLTLVLNLVSFWFIPIVLITDIGFVWCSVLLLQNPSRENARKIKNRVLFLFIVGLLAYLVGVFR